MYRVGILEDELTQSNMLKAECRRILGGAKAHFQIARYASGDQFLADTDKEPFDIMLIDILMEGTNGFETARWVREAWPSTAILFITQSADFMSESFDVRPLHYLIKPIDKLKLERLLLSDYYARYIEDYFVFESPLVKTKLRVEDVIYLEISNRKVAVHTSDQTVYQAGKLTALLEALPVGYFIRTHQGYAVNITHVLEVSRDGVLMDSGILIPVSRAFYNDVKRVFMGHYLGLSL